jgi:tRNA-splicing ligase RtcB
MEKACLLPVPVAGALMPGAHVGYGLPIGGVLATENAVIPYAVGVDIACRTKMTVPDILVRDLERKRDRLTRAIEAETRFGVGASFKKRRGSALHGEMRRLKNDRRVFQQKMDGINAGFFHHGLIFRVVPLLN